jgi:hypothetical protein
MCVFFSVLLPCHYYYYCPSDFSYYCLTAYKALEVDTLGTYVPLITALYHVVLLLSELSNLQPSHKQWQIRTHLLTDQRLPEPEELTSCLAVYSFPYG